MEKMIKGFLKGLVDEKVTEIGVVDATIIQALDKNKIFHDEAHDEVEQKVAAFVKQMQDEHEPVCEAFNQEKKDLWNQIYDQFDIPKEDREQHYTIDRVTGMLMKNELTPGKLLRGDDDEEEEPEIPLQ